MDAPLWKPSRERIDRAHLTRFGEIVRSRWGAPASTYHDLYRFSIDRPEQFWSTMWDFGAVIGDPGDTVIGDLEKMPGPGSIPTLT